jgi:hypothetical protein
LRPERRGTEDHPGIFAGLLLQGIIILKKAEKAVNNPFLLCWRTFPESWLHGFSQALTDDRRAPEGLGA